MKPAGSIVTGFEWPKVRCSLKLLAALLLVAPPVLTAEELPNLAQVSNLAQDDHLNIRAEPRSNSNDIGDLQIGTVVEILEYSDDQKWARIVWEESNGWVAYRFLNALQRPRIESGLPVGLICIGTEPFWRLSILDAGQVEYEFADNGAKTDIEWSAPSRNVSDMAYGFKSGHLTGVLERSTCQDGMSDRDYGWSLNLMLGLESKNLLTGCCMAN